MSEKTKILFVLHGWPASESGGTGQVVQALTTAMTELGFQVAVAAPANRIGPLSSSLNIDVHPLDVPSPSEWMHTWHQPTVDHQFAQLIQNWQPDILHIHHLSGLSFGMVQAAKTAGVRVVLTLHDYAIPCARGQLVKANQQICQGPEPVGCGQCLTSISALGPGRQKIKRLSRYIPRVTQRLHQRISRLPLLNRNIEQIAQQRIDGVQHLLQQIDSLDAPSMDLCNRISAMGYRRPQHSPLPLVHHILPAPNPKPGPVRFLFVGTLIPTKGPDRLVRAFRHLEPGQARLTLVGEDASYFGSTHTADFILKEAEVNGDIQYISSVPSAEMSALLANHDVLVLPSTWPENSPLVVREATAAGLRTIVGREGGAGELDPLAQTIGPNGIHELVHALQLECKRGRSRHAIQSWPTPKEVARWHIANSYGGIAG